MRICCPLSVFFLCIVPMAFGQWTYDNLSQPKSQVGAASLGTKVYFAGGDNGYISLDEVEIYDVSNDGWDSVIMLSEPRIFPTCAGTGGKVFFAGGWEHYSGLMSDRIDIWDTATKHWTLEYLSFPRMMMAVAGNGDKVLFAGGVNMLTEWSYDFVEIYDLTTMSWTMAHLCEARCAMAYAVIGDLAFFAGGINNGPEWVSNKVDIYRYSTDTWSTDSLSQARGFLAAGVAGSKIYFAGGIRFGDISSNRVDIYDTLTGTWTIDSLSEARGFLQVNAASVNDKIYFTGGGDFALYNWTWTSASRKIDIWDENDMAWKSDSLTEPLVNHGVAGVQGHLIVAGGMTTPSWQPVSKVEVYHDPETVIEFGQEKDQPLRVIPNPSEGQFRVEWLSSRFKNFSAEIYTIQGTLLYHQEISEGSNAINLKFPPGGYILLVRSGSILYHKLIVIR